MSRTTDLENCNFCKTVLMMLIVFYHSGLYWTGNWFVLHPQVSSSSLVLFCLWLNSFHVHAFTLISGYIYYYIRYERGRYDNPKEFIKNKCRRLLVPYLLVGAIWVIPVSDYFFHFPLNEIIDKYILGESPSQLWFLLMLFGVFALAYPLSAYFNRKGLRSFYLIVIIFLSSFILDLALPNLFQIFTAMKYLLFFWIGFMLRKYLHNIQLRKVLILGGGSSGNEYYCIRYS